MNRSYRQYMPVYLMLVDKCRRGGVQLRSPVTVLVWLADKLIRLCKDL